MLAITNYFQNKSYADNVDQVRWMRGKDIWTDGLIFF